VDRSGVLRAATLNTWGQRGNWEARLAVLREGFRELDADIVTLQETVRSDDTDRAADMLGPQYYPAQQQNRETDGQGITTASRWPFGRIFELDLHVSERTYDFACTCLVTEVLAPEPFGRVWVANHFPDLGYSLNRSSRGQRRIRNIHEARPVDR
jgi:endonuclease/exonuclease/phosphatase family metal-dependent hydrolase